MSTPNVFTTICGYDDEDPDGYRAGVAEVGKQARGTATNLKLFEVPPGQSICPYHYEYEEEWLIVLAGTPVLRAPDGERELGTGDVVCFPPGPGGAHKVTNRAPETARVLMFSSSREPAVAVYPDSDKLGVFTSVDADDLMVRRAEAHLPYYDGET